MAGKGELSDDSVDDSSGPDDFAAPSQRSTPVKQKPGRGAPSKKEGKGAPRKNTAYTTGEKNAAEKMWMENRARRGWTFKNLAAWFWDKYQKPL